MSSFHDVQFPTDLKYGVSGGAKFVTTVVGSEAGFEQRIGRWASARHVFTISAESWNYTRLQQLKAFFMARKGRLYAFRFKDWHDFTVGLSGPPWVLGTPQQFATGDGAETEFQLTKTYTSGATTVSRKITRPVTGTVRVFKNGVEMMGGWSVNVSTGIVTFTSAPANLDVLAWAGQFDVPVRFDSDEMSIDMVVNGIGEWPSVRLVEVRD